MRLPSVAGCNFPKPFSSLRYWRVLRTQVYGLVIFVSAAYFACAQSAPVNERFQQATQAMREGHLDEAAEGFQAVTAAQPGFAEAHLNLGLVLEELGRNEQAIASFQKALALKPGLHGANLFLGVAEYRLNHLDKAVAALQKETAGNPKDAGAWMWLGVVRLAQEHPDEAAEALDKAARLAPENVDILYQRGRAHLLVSKDSYSRMFKADPASWHVHQVLAQANAEADRDEDAIAEYQAAIKLAPNQPGLHEELGAEYQKTGKFEAAEAELRRELELDPHNVPARYKLGTLQIEQGNAAEGKEAVEAALKQNPRLKNASYYLGRAEMQKGNDAGAAEDFKRAVAADSDTEIVQQSWYQLGIVYRRLHRIAEAQRALATFQKMKDDETERQRQSLEKKKKAQGLNETPQDPSPKNP
jgi:tetratricopeptide (TPR) repeat protein